MMDADRRIDAFLNASSFAVAGASSRRHKYGNIIFRALQDSGRIVYPLNPIENDVEGAKAYRHLADLPEVPIALSIVTPPSVTRDIVNEAIQLGVRHLWMQPGAEDPIACECARDAGLSLIADQSCLLVALAIA